MALSHSDKLKINDALEHVKLLPYSVAEHQRIGAMLKHLHVNIIKSEIKLSNQLGKTKAKQTSYYKWLRYCEKACNTLKNYLEELMLHDHPDDSEYPNGKPLQIYYGEKEINDKQ